MINKNNQKIKKKNTRTIPNSNNKISDIDM